MATVNKNFRVKDGLIVEGSVGILNGSNILTEDAAQTLNNKTLGTALDANGNSVTNVAAPVNGGDATNKTYVDTSITNAVDAITTDVIEEGDNNLYFTDERAIAAVGGSATSANTPNSVVKRDGTGSFVAQDITLDGGIDVAGDSNVAGNSSVVGNLSVNGNASVAGTFDVSGDTSLANNASVGGDLAVSGSASVTGNLSVTGTTDVNGSAIVNLADPVNAQDAATKNYVDTEVGTAVANLVDSAPELLDTLNELAAAIGDNPNYATDVANLVSTTTTNLTNLINDEADARIAADTDLQNTIDALTTAEIAEDPAATGTSGTQYFTNQRAVDALEAVVPNFTEIEVNSIAKQIAATSSGTAYVQGTAYSWAKADYRSAKLVVKIDNGTHNEVSDFTVTLDSLDNIATTEYGITGTNGARGDITADISGSNVVILVTPTDDSTITVVGTLVA